MAGDAPNLVADVSAAVQAISSVAGTTIAAVALYYGWKQLKGLGDALRLQALTAILELENEIVRRRLEVAALGRRIVEEKSKPKPVVKRLEILDLEWDSHVEAYLGAVNRLAFCILKKYADGAELKAEYRDQIDSDVREFEEYFGAGTHFGYVLKLRDAWRTEDFAVRK